MSEYIKLPLRVLPSSSRLTPENKYWNSFKTSAEIKQIAKVTNIAYSPLQPFDFAAAASTRVSIYEPSKSEPRKVLSRFKDVALCSSWRSDARVVVAGGADGLVKLFDISSRSILRTFKGHRLAVHTVVYGADFNRVYSGSDDCLVKAWDVPTETAIADYALHSDYVRSVIAHSSNHSLIITSSYDSTARIIDTRLPTTQSTVQTVDHGDPVEAMLMLPDGQTLITVGGLNMTVWNTAAGGRMMHRVSNHQKTITSIAFDNADTSPHGTERTLTANRVLSGSLDQFVKFYDTTNFAVTHSMKMRHQILALGIAPDHSTLAIGQADGTLTIKQRLIGGISNVVASTDDKEAMDAKMDGGEDNIPTPAEAAAAGMTAAGLSAPSTALTVTTGSNKRKRSWFDRGQNSVPSAEDYRVESVRKQRLQAFDKDLRTFQYRSALDNALLTGNPIIICSLIDELIHRNALRIALTGRDDLSLSGILRFLISYMTHPVYSSVLYDVCLIILDVYSNVIGLSVLFDELIMRIANRVNEEVQVQAAAMKCLGQVQMILNANHMLQDDRLAQQQLTSNVDDADETSTDVVEGQNGHSANGHDAAIDDSDADNDKAASSATSRLARKPVVAISKSKKSKRRSER